MVNRSPAIHPMHLHGHFFPGRRRGQGHRPHRAPPARSGNVRLPGGQPRRLAVPLSQRLSPRARDGTRVRIRVTAAARSREAVADHVDRSVVGRSSRSRLIYASLIRSIASSKRSMGCAPTSVPTDSESGSKTANVGVPERQTSVLARYPRRSRLRAPTVDHRDTTLERVGVDAVDRARVLEEVLGCSPAGVLLALFLEDRRVPVPVRRWVGVANLVPHALAGDRGRHRVRTEVRQRDEYDSKLARFDVLSNGSGSVSRSNCSQNGHWKSVQ